MNALHIIKYIGGKFLGKKAKPAGPAKHAMHVALVPSEGGPVLLEVRIIRQLPEHWQN